MSDPMLGAAALLTVSGAAALAMSHVGRLAQLRRHESFQAAAALTQIAAFSVSTVPHGPLRPTRVPNPHAPKARRMRASQHSPDEQSQSAVDHANAGQDSAESHQHSSSDGQRMALMGSDGRAREQADKPDTPPSTSPSPDKFDSISTLAVGLGHDVGNIVLPIMCHLDSLLSQNLPAQAVQELLAVREAAKRLQRLSARLCLCTLDSEDAEASSFDSTTKVDSWWAEVVPIIEHSLPAHVDLVSEVPADLPAVKILPHQLMQVLMHLVSNSVEAISRTGQITVRFSAESDECVLLEVTDNGRGMAEHVRQRALDPFFTTKKRSLTTGLGLSQIKTILQHTGGSIDIQSAPGRGTTVSIRLPAAARQQPSNHACARPSARVMLDDQRLAAYAKTLLRTSGFEVQGASGGAEPVASQQSLWITEPKDQTLTPARDFLRKRPGRRVIVVGTPATEGWNEPGMVVVEGSHRSIHRALQRAAREIDEYRAHNGLEQNNGSGEAVD